METENISVRHTHTHQSMQSQNIEHQNVRISTQQSISFFHVRTSVLAMQTATVTIVDSRKCRKKEKEAEGDGKRNWRENVCDETYVYVQIVFDFVQQLFRFEDRYPFGGNFEIHCTNATFQFDIVLWR